MPIILSALQNYSIKLSGSFNATYFLFNYSLDNFHINTLKLDYAHTGIDMTNGVLKTEISNFALDWLGALSFTTDPVFFFGQGDGKYQLSNFNLLTSIDLDLGPNKLPKIKFLESRVDLTKESIRIKFNGTNDIFTLLEIIQGAVTPFIIRLIGGEMSDETKLTIQETINSVLAGLSNEYELPGTDIVLNYGFISSPSLKNFYLPIALNGSSACASRKRCIPFKGVRPDPPRPINVFGGKGVFQVLISDYFLNSLLIAAYEDLLMNFVITPEKMHKLTNGSLELNTDLFGVFIPDMRKVYGPNKNISMNFNVTYPPKFTVTTKDITCIFIALNK